MSVSVDLILHFVPCFDQHVLQQDLQQDQQDLLQDLQQDIGLLGQGGD